MGLRDREAEKTELAHFTNDPGGNGVPFRDLALNRTQPLGYEPAHGVQQLVRVSRSRAMRASGVEDHDRAGDLSTLQLVEGVIDLIER